MKLTPGGGATTSPVITVKPDAAKLPEGATATKLPNGAGTVVVKPGPAAAKPATAAEAATARLESLWEKAQRLTPFGKDDGE